MTTSINKLDDSSMASAPLIEIGDAVRRSREAAGYSVEDLAVTCGLTDVEIARIEIGADVDPGRLRRIATALQMPASTFLSA
ncbi:helix-turn-helix domain-containing protein [Pararhizobium sp. BT-229]|uniref:helix-turn-helix domain-containing protein n=1 Tax=Pararhizobium sp. BT-229 TaxID=2986923 RepID=UPI0021F71792|nr:helix-turn-helix domain-containing protein [Pararhizobium sp. BT-229]MCV9962245.1 helix-turn-helix domain-containing protein [Pararhizobium sp. BT-229]